MLFFKIFSFYFKIITDENCTNPSGLSAADKLLCEPYLDVQTFLGYHSKDDYKEFCLAYAFAARDFADGTLGLAWVAKPSGTEKTFKKNKIQP